MRGQVLSRKRVGIALLLALLVSVALAWSIDGIRWRLQVAGLKAAGNLDDIGWAEMALMMRPGSPYSLEPLRENSNAFAVILNPHDSPADRQAGEQLFGEYCALCHGPKGEAGPAPSLLGTFKMGDSDWALFRTISGRVRELTMPPVPLPEKETWQVVSYLRALRSPVGNHSAESPERPQERGDRTGAGEPYRGGAYRASELADVLRLVPELASQPAGPDQLRQRRRPKAGLVASARYEGIRRSVRRSSSMG